MKAPAAAPDHLGTHDMKHIALAAIAAGLLSTAPAEAALLTFTLTGAHTASFQLDSNPTTNNYSSVSFGILNQTITFDGATQSNIRIDFGNAGSVFQFRFTDSSSMRILDATGPSLFSGASNMPTLATGTYALTDRFNSNLHYSLAISDPSVASVPEPASWALMMGGFALAGGAIRSRRKGAAFA
jgi:hypothetical protein